MSLENRQPGFVSFTESELMAMADGKIEPSILPEYLKQDKIEQAVQFQRDILKKVGILNSQGRFKVTYQDSRGIKQTREFSYPTPSEAVDYLANLDQDKKDKLTEILAKFEQDGGSQLLVLPTIPLSPDSQVISALEGQMKKLFSQGKLFQSDGKTKIDGSDSNRFDTASPTYIDSEVLRRAYRDPQNPNNFISQEQWATGSSGVLYAFVPKGILTPRQRDGQNPFHAFNANKKFPQQLADIAKTGNQDLLYLTFELCAYRQMLALFPEDNQPAMVLNNYSNPDDASTWVLGSTADESRIDAERRFAGSFCWDRVYGQPGFYRSGTTNLNASHGCVPASVN